jgi:hypothetical protein
VLEADGVYVAEVHVVFSPPPDPSVLNRYVNTGTSAIAIAGVVASVVDPSTGNAFSSPAATLAGAGVREGSWVKLPDSGGQWSTAFNDPWLDVQVVSTTESKASSVMAERLAAIDATLDRLQDEAGISPSNRFVTQLSPKSGPQIYYVHGRNKAAFGMTLVLGLGVTVALLSWLAGRMGFGRQRAGRTSVHIRPLRGAGQT